MAGATELVGDTVLRTTGEKVEVTDICSGKILGLYFSANWCPPCRQFTPTLVSYYEGRKNKNDFEVIFVSLDESEEEFEKYFMEMPWCAIPFTDEKRKADLEDKYKIKGTPTLVLVEADSGMKLCDNARRLIQEIVKDSSKKDNFPFTKTT